MIFVKNIYTVAKKKRIFTRMMREKTRECVFKEK